MINKCPCCNSTPKEAGFISCDNIKCLKFEEEYFVWEWQLLAKPEVGEHFIEAHSHTISLEH
jgi:hypothetical protein